MKKANSKRNQTTRKHILRGGVEMDERKQRMEAELAKLGIHTVDELNEAIKKEKALDLSMMTGTAEAGRKAG